LKKNKESGSDQIPTVLIKAGAETIKSEIPKLIKYIWNEEKLPHQLKESITNLKEGR
jgi:hypothetical protein